MLEKVALVARVSPPPAWPGRLCFRRGLATAAKSPDRQKLPLAGVRVLDMSRILAGVGVIYSWQL
ncbi:uncharacterized protein N7482_008256 [Penicillium canariense]|uniref:Uncharacterized protein n=1 Tax=Penicillium canariense TaxID=189055 RepID=A0A9W9HTG1_9EURO|nr:uncharacterized protein N7482_008256 [Penicillium canariense]KAJ5157156.1 hypothetical protein N7482_008256 [Penicillium canariense]